MLESIFSSVSYTKLVSPSSVQQDASQSASRKNALGICLSNHVPDKCSGHLYATGVSKQCLTGSLTIRKVRFRKLYVSQIMCLKICFGQCREIGSPNNLNCCNTVKITRDWSCQQSDLLQSQRTHRRIHMHTHRFVYLAHACLSNSVA